MPGAKHCSTPLTAWRGSRRVMRCRCEKRNRHPEEPRVCAASRRMAAGACGASFEARREERRAPQDDGSVGPVISNCWQRRESMTDIFDIYLLEAMVNGILLGGVLALLALGL